MGYWNTRVRIGSKIVWHYYTLDNYTLNIFSRLIQIINSCTTILSTAFTTIEGQVLNLYIFSEVLGFLFRIYGCRALTCRSLNWAILYDEWCGLSCWVYRDVSHVSRQLILPGLHRAASIHEFVGIGDSRCHVFWEYDRKWEKSYCKTI